MTQRYYELGSPNPVGRWDYYSSGSTSFIAGVTSGSPQSYSPPDQKWTCHYCGGMVNAVLDQCPKCAGEKRESYRPSAGYANVEYVRDEPEEVAIAPKKAGLLDRIRMAIVG